LHANQAYKDVLINSGIKQLPSSSTASQSQPTPSTSQSQQPTTTSRSQFQSIQSQTHNKVVSLRPPFTHSEYQDGIQEFYCGMGLHPETGLSFEDSINTKGANIYPSGYSLLRGMQILGELNLVNLI